MQLRPFSTCERCGDMQLECRYGWKKDPERKTREKKVVVEREDGVGGAFDSGASASGEVEQGKERRRNQDDEAGLILDKGKGHAQPACRDQMGIRRQQTITRRPSSNDIQVLPPPSPAIPLKTTTYLPIEQPPCSTAYYTPYFPPLNRLGYPLPTYHPLLSNTSMPIPAHGHISRPHSYYHHGTALAQPVVGSPWSGRVGY